HDLEEDADERREPRGAAGVRRVERLREVLLEHLAQALETVLAHEPQEVGRDLVDRRAVRGQRVDRVRELVAGSARRAAERGGQGQQRSRHGVGTVAKGRADVEASRRRKAPRSDIIRGFMKTIAFALAALLAACQDASPPPRVRGSLSSAPEPAPIACKSAPPPLSVEAPERDLNRVEGVSNSIKKTTMKGVCKALLAFDFDGVARHFAEDAAVERLFPRTEEVVVKTPRTLGTLVRPARAGCFGSRADLVADLRNLLGGLARLDRCFFKPYRV